MAKNEKQVEFAHKVAQYVYDCHPATQSLSKLDAMQEAILVIFEDEGTFRDFLEALDEHQMKVVMEYIVKIVKDMADAVSHFTNIKETT